VKSSLIDRPSPESSLVDAMLSAIGTSIRLWLAVSNETALRREIELER